MSVNPLATLGLAFTLVAIPPLAHAVVPAEQTVLDAYLELAQL